EVNNGGVVHSFLKWADAVPLALDCNAAKSGFLFFWRSETRNEQVFPSPSGRGHGPDRSDQACQGQHAGDPARGTGARLAAFLRGTAGPVAARRHRLGASGTAAGVR